MADKNWKKIRIQRCEHAGCDVALEVEEVYPADHLPDQPPRISGHRCSHGIDCMMLNNPACLWSGWDTGFDPFRE